MTQVTVFCPSCKRTILIEPAFGSINAGHANVYGGTIQCACGKQIPR